MTTDAGAKMQNKGATYITLTLSYIRTRHLSGGWFGEVAYAYGFCVFGDDARSAVYWRGPNHDSTFYDVVTTEYRPASKRYGITFSGHTKADAYWAIILRRL